MARQKKAVSQIWPTGQNSPNCWWSVGKKTNSRGQLHWCEFLVPPTTLPAPPPPLHLKYVNSLNYLTNVSVHQHLKLVPPKQILRQVLRAYLESDPRSTGWDVRSKDMEEREPNMETIKEQVTPGDSWANPARPSRK